MTWTPDDISALLTYYAIRSRTSDNDSIVANLIDQGLLTRDGQLVELTDKGLAFIELGLLSTPLPVWSMPVGKS